jgi:4-aminobutyrate aminotransferase-like enzyme
VAMRRIQQERYLAREQQHLPVGGSHEARVGRRVFVEGRNAVLTDLDGNQYIDLAGGTLTQSVGHCHPHVVERLREQAGRLWNVHDAPTPNRAELCELLAALLPEHLTTFAFFSTGAEVVEAAVRIVQAMAPPGRNRLGALRHGFHGKTQGARMLVHADVGYQSFAGNSILGYSPYCYRCPFGLTYPSCNLLCAELVCRQVATKDTVSALVFEPVLGAAGIIVPPPGYWEMITEACKASGVLLVADEVLTGGGRTGSFLASTLVGADPDLVALSKGLASGFPIGVLAGRADLLGADSWQLAGSYSSTYGGNPLGLTAARATIEIIAREDLLARVRRLGALVDTCLAAMLERYQVIGDVRGVGLLHGLEFVTDRESRRPAPAIAEAVHRRALDLGVRTALGGSVLRLAPPFTIEEPLLQAALVQLDRAIGAVVADGVIAR